MDCSVEIHESLKLSEEAWSSLIPAGVQRFDGLPVLELRTCPRCQSTLARRTLEVCVVCALASAIAEAFNVGDVH